MLDHTRAASILVVLITFGLGASPSGAGFNAPDVDALTLAKIREGGTTYLFEACVEGTFIQTDGTVDYPQNPQGPRPLTFDVDEWCYEETFASAALLDAAFPSEGEVYTFTLPSEAGTFFYTAAYTASKPDASVVVSFPAADSNVLEDRDLTTRWTLSGPCTDTCDGIQFEFDSAVAERDARLPITATSQVTLAADIVNGPGNDIAVSVYDGILDSTPPEQNNDPFLLSTVWELIEDIPVSGVPRTLDIFAVEAFKGLDRIDGSPEPIDPYFLEACVRANGLVSATFDTPDGLKPMLPEDSEFCFDANFQDQGTLDSTYPSEGETYTFNLTQADGAVADVPFVFDLEIPGASIVIESPTQMATVPAEQDLTVMWSLDLGVPACNIAVDCGDGIAVFVEDNATEMEVFLDADLAIDATQVVVPAASLTAGPEFLLGVETLNLTQDLDVLDGETDTYDAIGVYEDLNEILFTVPEPAQALLHVLAGLTLAGLAGRRRRS